MPVHATNESGSAETSPDSNRFVFGVVPQQPPAKLFALWRPILDEVSKQAGVQLVFKTASNIPAFENAVRQGVYDLSYMNPYHYAVFHNVSGYSALVAKRPGGLAGIVVVKQNSPITSLEALAGKKMVFPSPAAFAASMLVRQELKQRGIKVDIDYVRNHDSVYANVAKGFAAAGGGVDRTFNTTNPDAKEALRVLWRSGSYTPHPIAAQNRVPHALQQKIQQAFIDLSNTEKGKAMLKKLRIPSFGVVNDDHYESVRALNWNDLPGSLSEVSAP